MQEKEVKYNLTPTDDPVIAKDYDGFIGPNGEFYMVSPKFTHKPTHNDWADEYCSMLMEKKDGKEIINNEILYGGSNKYLIDGLGFIYYSHSMQHDKHPIIVYPKRFWFKKRKRLQVSKDKHYFIFFITIMN